MPGLLRKPLSRLPFDRQHINEALPLHPRADRPLQQSKSAPERFQLPDVRVSRRKPLSLLTDAVLSLSHSEGPNAETLDRCGSPPRPGHRVLPTYTFHLAHGDEFLDPLESDFSLGGNDQTLPELLTHRGRDEDFPT